MPAPYCVISWVITKKVIIKLIFCADSTIKNNFIGQFYQNQEIPLIVENSDFVKIYKKLMSWQCLEWHNFIV